MLFQIISFLSLSYLSIAVPTLNVNSRQEPAVCIPTPPSESSNLLGGKLRIQDSVRKELYWTAVFDTASFLQEFIEVLLEVRFI
jgi:hypothetical protein